MGAFDVCGAFCVCGRYWGGGGVVMWFVILVVGFLTAIAPTLLWQTWNGLSLLGVMVVLVAGGFIVRNEAMDDK
jgi:hypothetical protein